MENKKQQINNQQQPRPQQGIESLLTRQPEQPTYGSPWKPEPQPNRPASKGQPLPPQTTPPASLERPTQPYVNPPGFIQPIRQAPPGQSPPQPNNPPPSLLKNKPYQQPSQTDRYSPVMPVKYDVTYGGDGKIYYNGQVIGMVPFSEDGFAIPGFMGEGGEEGYVENWAEENDVALSPNQDWMRMYDPENWKGNIPDEFYQTRRPGQQPGPNQRRPEYPGPKIDRTSPWTPPDESTRPTTPGTEDFQENGDWFWLDGRWNINHHHTPAKSYNGKSIQARQTPQSRPQEPVSSLFRAPQAGTQRPLLYKPQPGALVASRQFSRPTFGMAPTGEQSAIGQIQNTIQRRGRPGMSERGIEEWLNELLGAR